MSQLNLYLLGPPRLERDGVPVHIPRRKAMALLAYLAVNGQNHSRDSLAALLWPENDQSKARAELRRMLSVLNRTLGDGCLVADRETVCLSTQPELIEGMNFWLDVAVFQSKLKITEAHNHPASLTCPGCTPILETVVDLYTGDFMAGFSLKDCPAYDEWQFFQGEELRGQFANTLTRLSSHFASIIEHETAIRYARRWLSLDPTHEPAHRHLMSLYQGSGQHTAALRQYETCQGILADELGVEPSEETRELYDRIRTTTLISLPVSRPKNNLPAQTTTFIGREAELAEIQARLKEPDCRLLTLLGPGGSGKTRLAIEAANRLLEDFRQGAYFVNLAPVSEPAFIPTTVAQALAYPLQDEGTPEAQIIDNLRNKEILLILDNFEHLLAGVRLVNEIMKAAPRVKILATSRERLMVTGEHIYPVMGMAYPESPGALDLAPQNYSALRLFESEAIRVLGDFKLTEDNILDVIRICGLLEGLPLGIVLAANWVRTLPLAEIAAEIAQDLAFLSSELQDLPQRQRSLRSVFNHSWQLLNDRERDVMKALSVFRGGFTREAAQEIAGATLSDLMHLIDASILHRSPSNRYEIHELLRQYAVGKLDLDPEVGNTVRERHSQYYCRALARWERDLQGPRQKAARLEMGVDIDNIRTAWTWAVENSRWNTLLRAMDGLCTYLDKTYQGVEAEKTCRSLIEKLTIAYGCPKSTPLKTQGEILIDILKLQIRTLAWGCLFTIYLGNNDLAYDLGQECLATLERNELAEQETRFEEALIWLSFSYLRQKWSQTERIQFAEQAADMFNTINAGYWEGTALHALGLSLESISQLKSIKVYDKCLAVYRQLGNLIGVATTLDRLSWLEAARFQFDKAEGMLYEALSISKELEEYQDVVAQYGDLGIQWVWAGRFHEAQTLLREVLEAYQDLEYRHSYSALINVRPCFPDLYLGEYQTAKEQTRHALDLFQEQQYFYSPHNSTVAIEILGCIALAEGSYVEANEMLQECLRVVNIPDRVGKSHACLGYTKRGLNRISQAKAHFFNSLSVAIEATRFLPLTYTIPGVALLFADQGEIERAVELYALAATFGLVANSKWFADIAGDEIAAAAQALPVDVVEAAKERGQARDLWETGQELLVELKELGWGKSD